MDKLIKFLKRLFYEKFYGSVTIKNEIDTLFKE